MDDAIKEVKPSQGIMKRPDCQAPGCTHPKETALVSFGNKWVCGDCAMRKQEEINARIWG